MPPEIAVTPLAHTPLYSMKHEFTNFELRITLLKPWGVFYSPPVSKQFLKTTSPLKHHFLGGQDAPKSRNEGTGRWHPKKRRVNDGWIHNKGCNPVLVSFLLKKDNTSDHILSIKVWNI